MPPPSPTALAAGHGRGNGGWGRAQNQDLAAVDDPVLDPAGGRLLLGAGFGSVLAGPLLVLLVLGNTQACLAPLSMTLLFG